MDDVGRPEPPLAASPMTLGGMLKHLVRVEDVWFSQRLHGRDAAPLWDTVDWAEEWHSAAEDTPEELLALWQAAVARSRSRVAEAMADGGLDGLATGIPAPGARRRPACDGSSST